MNFENGTRDEEEFQKFMKEVRAYSNELLDLVGEKNSPIVFPAVLMLMVKVCYVLADGKEEPFLRYVADVKEGMDSLSADFVSQIRAKKNSH